MPNLDIIIPNQKVKSLKFSSTFVGLSPLKHSLDTGWDSKSVFLVQQLLIWDQCYNEESFQEAASKMLWISWNSTYDVICAYAENSWFS